MPNSLKHKPYAKFKGKLRELGLTYADIAQTLKKSETTISQKVNGYSDFSISEVELIEEKHGISRDVFT